MNARRDARNKVPYGPNIVRAWFDTVLQPALQGLENERRFLKKHNWTLRFRVGHLEYLAVLEEHLPAAAVANLHQFASFFPGIETAIERHDEYVGVLALDCRVLHKAILNSPHFRGIFAAVSAETRNQLGRDFQTYFGGSSSEEDFMGTLAEYLVNNIGDLPSAYVTADLWNHYRARFEAAIATPELEEPRKQTLQDGQNLLREVEKLGSLMKKVRDELSLRFDVPIVETASSAR